MAIFKYSLLTQRTEIGLRSFPLTSLAQFSAELCEIVIEITSRPPVKELLSLSVYTPLLSETIFITSLQPRFAATT